VASCNLAVFAVMVTVILLSILVEPFVSGPKLANLAFQVDRTNALKI